MCQVVAEVTLNGKDRAARRSVAVSLGVGTQTDTTQRLLPCAPPAPACPCHVSVVGSAGYATQDNEARALKRKEDARLEAERKIQEKVPSPSANWQGRRPTTLYLPGSLHAPCGQYCAGSKPESHNHRAGEGS